MDYLTAIVRLAASLVNLLSSIIRFTSESRNGKDEGR